MGRAPCCEKNGGIKKGPWTAEEDQKLIDYIQKHGHGNWRTLPKNAGLQRCGKSCRLRWTNYLRPDIKRGRFSFEEEEAIIQLHSLLGNKWSAIAARLPGRTDNEIKNFWNTHIRKKLLRMGIDPVTHSPRVDLLDMISSLLINSSSSSIHHMNTSPTMLMAAQYPLLNPDVLRLATSLIDPNQTHVHMHGNGGVYGDVVQTSDQLYNMIQEPDQSCMAPFTGFGEQSSQWHYNGVSSDIIQDSMPPLPPSCHYSSSEALLDPSNYYSDQNDQNFNFASVLTTPTSSPTPLNSNSTYINGSSCSTEDEKESDCSNLMKFEIPDLWDIGFM